MANKRDIELLLKATDLSSKTFAEVSAAVGTLTTKLAAQSEAATKGQASVKELSATMRQLEEAGRALANQQGTIDAYKKTSEQLVKATADADTLKASFDKLHTTQAASDAVSKTQASALNSAGAAAGKAQETVAALQDRLAAQAASLAAVGIATSNLAATEQGLVAAVIETTTARRAAQESLDQYDARLREHKALTAAIAAQEREEAAAAVLAARAVTEAERAQAAAATASAAAEKARLAAITDQSSHAFQSDQVLNDLRVKDAQRASAQRIAAEAAVVEAERRQSVERKAIIDFQIALVEQAEARNRASLARSAADNAKQTANIIANSKAVAGAASGSLGGASGTRDTGILGLKAYELQNLSFQINDVITGLASGQKATQVLAQQGGQVFQIFERQIGSLTAVLPQLIGAAAVVAAIAAVFTRAANTQASIRDFNAQLTLSTDGAKYNAAAVVGVQRELQKLGADFDEAGKALKIFIAAGVDPSRLKEFGKAAEELSRTFGVGLVEAAKDVSSAFTTGYDAVTKLDKAYNFLTVAQQATIRELFDLGKTVEAQNLAFEIFNGKVDAAGKQVGGPFTQAFRTARAAIYDLLDLLANSLLARMAGNAILFLANRMQDVATGLRVIIATLPGGGGVANDAAIQGSVLAKLQASRASLAASSTAPANGLASPQGLLGADGKPMPGSLTSPDADKFAAAKAAQLAAYDAQILQVQTHIKELEKVTAEADGTAAAAGAAKLKTGANLLDDQDRQIARAKGLNDQQRIAEAGKAAADKLNNAGADPAQAEVARAKAIVEETRLIAIERVEQENTMLSKLQSLRATADKSQKNSVQYQIDGIKEQYKTAYQQLDAFVQKGGKEIGGKSPEAYRAELDASQALAIKGARDKIGAAEQKQTESLQAKLAAIIAEGDKAQKGNLDAQLDAVTQKYAAIGAKIADYAKSGGSSIGGVSVDAYKAQIAQSMEFIKQQVTIKFYTDNINEATEARTTIFKAINDEVKDGTKTALQGYEASIAANARLSPKVAELARDALKFAEALNAAHPSPQLEAFIAKTSRSLAQATGPATAPTSALGVQSKDTGAAGMAEINDLQKTRNDLVKAFRDLEDKGIISSTAANAEVQKAFDDVRPAIDQATKSLEEFIKAKRAAGEGSTGLDLLAAQVKEVKANTENVSPEFVKLQKTIEGSFATGSVTALSSVSEAIGKAVAGTQSWSQSFKDMGTALLQFFADFAKNIATAILQEEALTLAKQAGAAIRAALIHGGGIVGGSSGMTRTADPGWFTNAPRYHDGTVVGLGSNEQAAILQHGEEVLAKDDPRNVLNSVKKGAANAGQPAATNIRSVLVLDKGLIPQAMSSSEGEAVTMAHIKSNVATIKQLVNTGSSRAR